MTLRFYLRQRVLSRIKHTSSDPPGSLSPDALQRVTGSQVLAPSWSRALARSALASVISTEIV